MKRLENKINQHHHENPLFFKISPTFSHHLYRILSSQQTLIICTQAYHTTNSHTLSRDITSILWSYKLHSHTHTSHSLITNTLSWLVLFLDHYKSAQSFSTYTHTFRIFLYVLPDHHFGYSSLRVIPDRVFIMHNLTYNTLSVYSLIIYKRHHSLS